MHTRARTPNRASPLTPPPDICRLPYLLFVQLLVIIALSGLVAAVVRRLWQPPVVAQMVAGLLLGPSLLGALAPSWERWLFPSASLGLIDGVGQLGVVAYMFVVGNELDHLLVLRRARGVLGITVAGVGAPLLCGLALAVPLVGDTAFFAPGPPAFSKMLFFATAMAVTAFPVMARIIDEHGLSGTVVGNLALSAGSLTDVAAWCLLAVVLAAAKGDAWGAGVTLAGTVAFGALALVVGRPLLRAASRDGGGEGARMAVVLVILMAAASATSAIGIHPALGAFVVGALTPRTALMGRLRAWLGPAASYLLLPVFFVATGLHTSFGLLTGGLLALMVLITASATLSKAGACYLAARLTGLERRAAGATASLMNARGLVELVLLSVGLQQRLITPTFFSIMVCVTVLTTVSAGPGLRLFGHVVDGARQRTENTQLGVIG